MIEYRTQKQKRLFEQIKQQLAAGGSYRVTNNREYSEKLFGHGETVVREMRDAYSREPYGRGIDELGLDAAVQNLLDSRHIPIDVIARLESILHDIDMPESIRNDIDMPTAKTVLASNERYFRIAVALTILLALAIVLSLLLACAS